MMPPDNRRRAAKPTQMKSPMKSSSGRKESATAQASDDGPTPVTSTLWSCRVDVRPEVLSAVGIWVV